MTLANNKSRLNITGDLTLGVAARQQ